MYPGFMYKMIVTYIDGCKKQVVTNYEISLSVTQNQPLSSEMPGFCQGLRDK